MARLILAKNGDNFYDFYAECQWVDGHGAHSRRCSEDFDEITTAGLESLFASNPDVLRWQFDRHGSTVQVGLMKDGDTGPRYDYSIKSNQAVKSKAAAMMDWADAYSAGWMVSNDAYELERHISRMQDHLDTQTARLNKLRGR